MPPLSCRCPRCETTLRVKDRTYLHRPIPCPACRSLLVLAVNESEQLVAALQTAPDSARSAPSPDSRLPVSPPVRHWTPNVTVVSWTATLLVAGLIGGLLWRNQRPRPKPVPPPIAETEEVHQQPDEPAAIADADPEPAVVPEEHPIQEPPLPVKKPLEIDDDLPPADALAVVTKAPAQEESLPPAAAPPEPPPVDFEARLSQPLAAFRQTRAIPRRELLELLEDLIGAPIRYDAAELGDAAAHLERTLSFELQDTTVGGVLAKVLDETGLAYDQERDALRLRKVEQSRDESPESRAR